MDSVAYGYGKYSSYAFCDPLYWDGDENHMRFVVADSIKGHRVESLGGYLGRGVPTAFGIYRHGSVWGKDARWDDELYGGFDESEVIPLVFTVELGANIRVDTLRYTGKYCYIPNEDKTQTTVYEVSLRYEFREPNKYFTAVDGQLVKR